MSDDLGAVLSIAKGLLFEQKCHIKTLERKLFKLKSDRSESARYLWTVTYMNASSEPERHCVMSIMTDELQDEFNARLIATEVIGRNL